MNAEGQYQGSQAFSHIVPSQNESVNPNTGSLNYRMPLIALRGVRPSIDLELNMVYSFGTAGTFGLPANWSLDLPYVTDGKSVTSAGRTYAIDFEWADVTGYASGLKYMNNHGIKFQKIVPPQDLPTGLPGRYGYKLDQVDGSSDYFDVNGKPLEHHDIYGNFIHYTYTQDLAAGVTNVQVRLECIRDSWGQEIRFEYLEYSTMILTLPGNSATTLTFSEDGILCMDDPAGLRTTFNYVPFIGNDSWKVLSSITYPTGLLSRYEYDPVRFLDANGNAQYMPMVKDHYDLDTNDILHSHTSYNLGGYSNGRTYTGAAIGLKMAGATDTLMDAEREALTYTYDVTKTSYDETDNYVARTTTWFNNYHLPITQIRYKVTPSGDDFVESYQTKFTYDIPINEHARATAYEYPASTEVLNNTATSGDPNWRPLSMSTAKYNEFGNLTKSTEEMQVFGRGYVLQNSTENEYMTTSRRLQVVKKSIHRDAVNGTEDQTENQPTADERAVGVTITSFRSSKDQPFKRHTKKTFEYDDRGRNASETFAWAPGALVPEGSVSSVTNKIAYSFSNGILTQTAYDSSNNATVITYDMRKYAGPIMSKKLPRGQVEKFEYDSFSRLIRHTDALGHVTTTAYHVGPIGGSQSETSPLRYVKLTKFDVLGRETDVYDNGDPTKPFSSAPTRLLSGKRYDVRSRLKESTDNLGLTTKFKYDSLDRQTQAIDPKGNVVEQAYDDTRLTITETLNGDQRVVTQLNARSDKMQVATYPDWGDSSAGYYLREDTAYDGNKRMLSKTMSQMPKSGGNMTVLEKTEVEYGPASSVVSKTVTGTVDSKQDVVNRSYTHDLFGNVYTWAKDTIYSDGRKFHHNGPVTIYDDNNRLSESRNQLGKKEVNQYDANGWLSKTVRFDGSQVSYECDGVGRFIKTAYPSSATKSTYNADGRLTKIEDGSDVIAYDMGIDGTLKKVTYADGKSQINTLDQYSRACKETDALGVTRETTYGEMGQVIKRTCKGDTVAYHYDTVNHTKGQLTGFSVSGGKMYTSTITYDGFNRIKRATAKDSGPKVLLDTIYEQDATSKITSLKTSSAVSSDLNCQRGLVYDGLGQIIKDTRSTGGPSETKYTYDGNSNIMTEVADGATTNMKYNAIDQRTDTGFTYDANGRMQSDNQGYKYKFDDRDRLVSVQESARTTGFEYRSDDYLSRRKGAEDSTQVYYNSGRINAMAVTGNNDGKTENSSLFSGTRHLVANYSDDKSSQYFMDSLGSTSLLLDGDKHTSVTYDAYGLSKASEPTKTPSSFGFGQEFTDPANGLVYLRSRYYNPKLMSFISMDRTPHENRYAYCEGDPINNLDPLGQSWEAMLALAVGAVVGGIVTGGVGFVVEAGLIAVGVAEVTAVTAAAVIGGAAGNVVGGLASSGVTGQKYTVENALVDAVVGAAGGYAGALVDPTAKSIAAGVKIGGKQLGEMGQKAVAAGIGGAVNNGVQATLKPLITNQPIDPLSIAASMAAGFASGFFIKTYALEYGKAQWKSLSPKALASTRQFISRVRARTQAAKTSEIDIMTASSVELVAFSSGRASAVDELADSLVRGRVQTLSSYGALADQDNIPVLITEL
ncbi:hypothetical protein ACN42_g5855 [Penicillium freii]|uniref:Insecticide toxin TcdB middle/N-terminal domain-containing protein n=1 Tax=Penicillium freii TaxID=48697 RepID=A0A101MIX4_PENFR|nr:hypothetical protein ACN42_g5855 [Penicillium freii]